MHAVTLFGAGVLGGLTGSIAGFASVATYPALFAFFAPVNWTAMIVLGLGVAGLILAVKPAVAEYF